MRTIQPFIRNLPQAWAGRLAGIALACAGLLACGDPAAATAAKHADAGKVADADALAADAQPGIPTVTGTSDTSGPYVEAAGAWNDKAQRLEIVVWVGNVTELLGVASHITYDATKLQLVTSEALDLTTESASTGFQYRAILKEVTPGKIVAGIARFRSVSHPFALPEGASVSRAQWLKLSFALKGTGTSQIAFDPPSRLMRKAKGDLVQAAWSGATVTVPDGMTVQGAP